MSLNIDPANGVGTDYTSYSLANAGNPSDGHWTSKAGDAGGVSLTATNPTSFLLDVATGAQHDGSDAGNSGLAYSSGTIGMGTRAVPISVRGLRMEQSITTGSQTASGTYERTIEHCLFAHNAGCITANGNTLSTSSNIVRNYNIRHNVIYFGNPATDNTVTIISCQAGIMSGGSSTGSITGTLNIEHNTVRQKSGQTNQSQRCLQLIFTAGGSAVVTMTRNVRNNVCSGAQTVDFLQSINAGTITVSGIWSHNASEDATADDVSATGALTGITVADCFTNVDSDLRLKAGSPLINAGVAISGVNDGYLGSAPDIGFDEYVPPPVITPLAGSLCLVGVGR